MKQIDFTVFEDYINYAPGISGHYNNVKPLKHIIGSQNFTVDSDENLQIKHYVGFYQKGNTRLQIIPKIYSNLNYELLPQSIIDNSNRIILNLYSWSGFLKFKSLQAQSIGSSKGDLLEIFINIFISEFLNLFRREIYNNYIPEIQNLQFIKGKILFSENIKKNILLKHLNWVQYDEYTINNDLNKFFKSTIRKLLSISRNSDNKKNLVIAINYLQDVDIVELDKGFISRIQFNRQNILYKPLFELARLFFHNQQPSMYSGQNNTFSFLTPLNLLFEYTVSSILESIQEKDFQYTYHSQTGLMYLNSKQYNYVEPDFIYKKDDKVVAILDTKFKNYIKLDSSEIYQLLTYALKLNCKNLFLIYPQFADSQRDDTLLDTYKIQTAIGEIQLSTIQIDLFQDNISEVIAKLKPVLSKMIFENK